jgi:hypothetical protein
MDHLLLCDRDPDLVTIGLGFPADLGPFTGFQVSDEPVVEIVV